jgi:phenylpyruvate tautomerase PptA (4-oxalocrotonate tautomerase family)
MSDAAGAGNHMRVQLLTPAGVLDREKQLGVVKELTEIVAAAAGNQTMAERTWVLITEAPDGGWRIAGHEHASRHRRLRTRSTGRGHHSRFADEADAFLAELPSA